MRNDPVVLLCCLLGAGAFFFSGPAFCQERDFDELRLEIGKMGLAEQEERPLPPAEKLLVDKEIKYVAGKDMEWFTEDDAVYEYLLVERDGAGTIFKTTRFTPGKDEVPFTYDDVLEDFQIFEYGFDGKLLKEVSYDGRNVKKYARLSSTVYAYDAQGRKSMRTCSYPGKKDLRVIHYAYDEAGHQVQAVEYFGKELQKYHRFQYGKDGKLIKVTEYHHEHDGKGPDGIWFTPDDVASSAKESFYNADESKAEDNKYISAGPDGKWFTPDDKMQYYVVFEQEGRQEE